MIKLIAVLCRIAAPFDCHDEMVTNNTSMLACTMAMRDLPEWAKQFPAYHLSHWKCQIGEKANSI